MHMKREKGRPQNEKGKPQKEIATYDFLDQLGITYEWIDHRPLQSMADCEEVDAQLEAVVCKNLFLHNAKKDQYYLLMVCGDKKFRSTEIATQIGSSRLSFADATELEALLALTPGSVSVMGLMNDAESSVQLLIDDALLDYDYFGCHPCVNTSSLRLLVADLLQHILPALGHTPIFVKMSGV